MPKNQDYSPPNLPSITTWPVSFKPFVNKAASVYWIPGQYMTEALTYTFVEDEIPKAPTMHIPKMGRFIYAYGTDKDVASLWCDAKAKDCHGGGGGGGGSDINCSICFFINFPNYGQVPWYQASILGWTGPIFRNTDGINYCRPLDSDPIFIAQDKSVCEMTIQVRQYDDPSKVVYNGPIKTYNPEPGWPNIYGAGCCFPPPPPPPPPPAGDCGGSSGGA